ncbi:MAG: class I SAM-dependent methyltransferase [Brevinematales bacterium]
MFSNKYDRVTKGSDGTRYKTAGMTKKYLNAGSFVLDYGCGTGIFACELSSCVKKITAIDISSKMLEEAGRKAQKLNITNTVFERASIFDGRFQQNSFDAVLAFNVLLFIKDPASVIGRIYELLKPGGYFLSSTECGGEKRSAIINMITSFLSSAGIVPYVRFFKICELEDSITGGNFQIVETGNFYTLNQPNHFVAAKKP